MKYGIIFLLFCIGACTSSHTDPVSVYAVVPNNENPLQARLSKVSLVSLTDLHTLQGKDFSFYAQAFINGSRLDEVLNSVNSFDELVAANERELNLRHPTLRMFFDGESYRAHDYDSLAMLSAFYHFEHVHRFFTSVLAPNHKAVSSHVKVLVYPDIVPSKTYAVPTITHDNAFYFADIDAFTLLRAAVDNGVPFPLNGAVIAHEFHHRVFFFSLFHQPGGFELFKKFYEKQKKMAIDRESILLSATDEGLADLAAVASSGSVKTLLASFGGDPKQRNKRQRDLEGSEFADKITYEDLRNKADLDKEIVLLCSGHSYDFQNPGWNYYCLGTIIARTFWDAAGRNVAVLREKILPQIYLSIAAIGAHIIAGNQYEIEFLLNDVARRIDARGESALKQQLCQAYATKFPSTTVQACI